MQACLVSTKVATEINGVEKFKQGTIAGDKMWERETKEKRRRGTVKAMMKE